MNNRIVVNENLQVNSFDNMFVLGDMSFVEDTGKRGLPMLAQVAQQQGALTGKNIARYIDGEELVPFTFNQKGILASLGRFKAIAEFKGIHIYGTLAWFIWRTVYLINFNSWSKRLKIMVDWTVNLFSKRDISDI
jgi:NADH dehydrogenase